MIFLKVAVYKRGKMRNTQWQQKIFSKLEKIICSYLFFLQNIKMAENYKEG